MCNLILLAGVPGTGKSTWARTFFDLKYAIVSSDQIRKGLAGSLKGAHERNLKPWDVFYKRIEDYLAHDVDVIADATFLTPRHREQAREVAERTGAKVHFVLFKNLQAAQDRNHQRDDDARVPDKVMDDMTNLYYDTLLDVSTNQEPYATVTLIAEFM